MARVGHRGCKEVAGAAGTGTLNEETGRYEVYPATRSLASLKGIVKKPAEPVSIEDMNHAIVEQAASAR
ncbi:AbrB family transcriptional regulator [Paraburkholderia strydomiana]|uniref:AbrB family transcriptional regulator n=1 Tax=Paraburkholderia strydomiana TaxID=1245417 RepID=UPI001BE9C4D7|nr:AbrB family transcriptional regulator [Paraburkholderia strydomiana]